jgi:hypothetical protein
MKRNFTIIGLLLTLLIAGNGCRNAKHDRKEVNDSTKMVRMHMGQNFRHNRGNESNSDTLMMRGMWRGMGRGWMPMGPGRRILESVPNVTEKQKRQIEELNKENRGEVMKLRQDMNAKIRNIMDSHRKEVLSILTDEQKKFIESGRMKHLF